MYIKFINRYLEILALIALSWKKRDLNLAKKTHEKAMDCLTYIEDMKDIEEHGGEYQLENDYYEKEDTPLIYPTMQFRDIFLSPNFASLIVNTHLKLSAGTAYSPTYSCQAILLLSSVKGKIFQNENEEVGYLSNLLIPILGLL